MFNPNSNEQMMEAAAEVMSAVCEHVGMGRTVAQIYDATLEHIITDGLQTQAVSDAARQAAQRIAEDHEDGVILLDSDGDWWVHQDGTMERIVIAEDGDWHVA